MKISIKNDLSTIIQSATEEKIALIKNAIESAAGDVVGEETETIEFNQEKILLNLDDYNLLQTQILEIDERMKQEIQAWQLDFTKNLTTELGMQTNISEEAKELTIETPTITVE